MPTLDYAQNENLGGVSLAAVNQSASCLLTTEGTRAQNSAQFTSGDWNYILVNRASWFGAQRPCFERHNDGANYSMVDGHAKWLKVDAIGNTPTSSVAGVAGTFQAWFSPGG